MNKWNDHIVDCIEHENKRHYLKGVPLVLLSATDYNPPWWYWLDYGKVNLN